MMKTILLVEDNTALGLAFQDTLKSANFQVIMASNGREALDLCQNNPVHIDLLLTDLIMPEMGGEELAAAILQIYPTLKIVIMSGYPDTDIRATSLKIQVHGWLKKPIALQNLLNTINSLIHDQGTAHQ
ncbi:MAG: response regulator [Chloroflexi bacterium]|nr:response regulator [Chloroflexota bacterium]MBK6711785.1 response regulator [Chloroflexota bacterium]